MGNKSKPHNHQVYPMREDPPPYHSPPAPCTVYPNTNSNDPNSDINNAIHADHPPPPPPTTSTTYGLAYKYKSSPHSPLHKTRSCTDILCFLLFLAFLGCWVFVAYLGMRTGDIRKVIFPTDSQGQICGQGPLSSRPYLLIHDLSQCLSPSSLLTGCPTPHVCVSRCPEHNYSPLGSAKFMLEDQQIIKTKMKPFCTSAVTDKEFEQKPVQKLVYDGQCPPWYLVSSPVLGRCLPYIDDRQEEELVVEDKDYRNEMQVGRGNLTLAIHRLAGVFSLRQIGEKVFSDLLDSWWIIGIALGGATILSFLWILLMRFLTGMMVWLSIFTVLGGLCGLLAYCSYRLYFIWVSSDPVTLNSILSVSWTPYYIEEVLRLRDTWLAFTIILAIMLLIIILLVVVLRLRISLAITLIEQAAQAVGQTLSSILFPIIPFFMQLLVCGWFLLVAALLATSSEQEYRVSMQEGTNCSSHPACYRTPHQLYRPADLCSINNFSPCELACPGAACQFVKYTRSRDYSLLQAVNVFGLYWGLFFCSSFAELVLAGVFSHWYWSRGRNRLPSWPVGRALANTVAFHLGTVAFGSLVIAIIRFVRLVFEYIEKKCKKFNNEIGRCILCCCKCCLWFLEKFMRFINRNAFIMCAVNGTNFCKSAKDAFNLLMRNLLRVVVLNSVCDFLLFIGKVVIVAACGSVSYLAFGGYIPHVREEIPVLNYFFIPIIFIIIGSYLITSAFFSVYSMSVDTLFLCFLEDLERNDGSDARPYFMSKRLKKVLGKMETVQSRNSAAANIEGLRNN